LSGFVTLTVRGPTSSSTNGDSGISRSIVDEVLEDSHPATLALEPLDDYVVIEYADEEAETRAGLILPANLEAQCRSGIVIAAGPAADGLTPGDKVLFPKGSGYDVRLAGIAQKVLRRGELIARIHD
jgi:co-chaperonin GroES (HSP10)